jgi:transposase-like protein
MKKDGQVWEAHLAAIEREAISVSAYAEREGVSAAAIYYWRQKLRGPAKVSKPAPGAFVQLRVAERSGVSSGSCTLVLSSVMRLEMSGLPSPEWLASLARAAHGVR